MGDKTSKVKMHKQETSGSRSASTSGIGMSAVNRGPTGPIDQAATRKQMSDEVRQRAEADMSILHRAHQIVTDKPRHAAVKQHAAEVFAAAQGPAISASKNAKGNTSGFPGSRGAGTSKSPKGK